ncbi:MAG: serine--tRNA ligase [Candidatus Kerfeldbacteria bacterium]|nr:serine--tRNA ligase [Candidatus Kerfeldbacteria bacterium]
MIDLNLIRQDPPGAEKKFKQRGLKIELKALLKNDAEYRAALQEIEALRAERNQKSPAAAEDPTTRPALKTLKDTLTKKERKLNQLQAELNQQLRNLPNLHFDDVPVGKDETGNKVLREVGERPSITGKPKDYFDIARALNLIDTDKAAEVSGSRFAYLKNEAVLLEFALIQHAFSRLVAEGFTPVIPPMMIRPDIYEGMGRLAGDQKEERYYLDKDNLYLIGSAEHTLGPLHFNDLLLENDLPKRYLGFSSCFRREAGSYGKDTKGILRVHQFDKVEMFSFTTPERSEDEHHFLLSMQERLVGDLKIAYRVVEICTGDIGWTDARQFDIETWFPAQNKYRETHSCSNTTDFQARGINARYRSKHGTQFMHMLNATAYAMSRTPAAIIENYQQPDGSVAIPKILQPYMGNVKTIAKKK